MDFKERIRLASKARVQIGKVRVSFMRTIQTFMPLPYEYLHLLQHHPLLEASSTSSLPSISFIPSYLKLRANLSNALFSPAMLAYKLGVTVAEAKNFLVLSSLDHVL